MLIFIFWSTSEKEYFKAFSLGHQCYCWIPKTMENKDQANYGSSRKKAEEKLEKQSQLNNSLNKNPSFSSLYTKKVRRPRSGKVYKYSRENSRYYEIDVILGLRQIQNPYFRASRTSQSNGHSFSASVHKFSREDSAGESSAGLWQGPAESVGRGAGPTEEMTGFGRAGPGDWLTCSSGLLTSSMTTFLCWSHTPFTG